MLKAQDLKMVTVYLTETQQAVYTMIDNMLRAILHCLHTKPKFSTKRIKYILKRSLIQHKHHYYNDGWIDLFNTMVMIFLSSRLI